MTIATQYQHDTVIYIGRFQPFHNAHLETILKGLDLAHRVVVVIGSANQPRDEDNPFTQEERKKVIFEAVGDAINPVGNPHTDSDLHDRLKFVYVENQIYSNGGWGMDVAAQVEPFLVSDNVRIIGHSKDETSFYLHMFPQWKEPIEMPLVEVLDATTIRELYFGPKCNLNLFKGVVPNATTRFLEKFLTSPDYQYVVDEASYIHKYKKQFEHLPYPISFNTGDAIIFKDGHVLLIERGANPGKGLYAFPGGFLNAKKTVKKDGTVVPGDANMLECAIRELYEETKIKLPEALVRGCIKEEKVFSAEKRSRRGRVITTAQIIVLPSDGKGLPKVKGSDDARKAEWHPIHKLSRIQFFEDHYDMMMFAVSQLKKYQ